MSLLDKLGWKKPSSNQEASTPPGESESHPEYPAKLLKAIKTIAINRDKLQDIEALAKSPIFDACEAIDKQQKGQLNLAPPDTLPSNKTFLDASGAKGLFDSIWGHFAKVIHSENITTPLLVIKSSLKNLETVFVSGARKPVDFFRYMLNKEDETSRKNEEIGQNSIARIGGTHDLTLNLPARKIPEGQSDKSNEHIESLKIAAAQSFVQYLLNQKDFAGHSPEKISLPDPDYSRRTRENALQILRHLRDNQTGWESLAPPELAAILRQKITIPPDDILKKPLYYGTHDYNLVQDENGKDKFADPQISLDQSTGTINVDQFAVQLFSVDGAHYALSNLKDIFNSSNENLFNHMATARSNDKFKWQELSTPKHVAELPQPLLAISFSLENGRARDQLFSHRANNGRINTHIHLDINKNSSDELHILAGHRHKDGQANNADANTIGKSLGIELPTILPESITINPFFPSTSPRLALMEGKLGLSDVEIGLNFDEKTMNDAIIIINDSITSPISAQIREVLGSSPSTDEVIKILNPDLGRHVLLGLIMEQDGPTANCVFPYQKYARLAFSIYPNISQTINRFLSDGEHSSPQDLEEILGAIQLALADQTLTRLGLSPLGFLAIYTSGKKLTIEPKSLAQGAAEVISPDAKAKADILFQISELKEGLSSIFTSAKSRFNGSTTNAIALINGRVNFRVDLNDPALLEALNIALAGILDAVTDEDQMKYYKELLPIAAKLKFQKRTKQWEQLAQKLANKLIKDDE